MLMGILAPMLLIGLYEAQLVSAEELIKEYLGDKELKNMLAELPKDDSKKDDDYVLQKLKNSSGLRIPKNTEIQGQFSLLKKMD